MYPHRLCAWVLHVLVANTILKPLLALGKSLWGSRRLESPSSTVLEGDSSFAIAGESSWPALAAASCGEEV